MPRWSHSEAFAFFKAKGSNSRWSWSARSSDGKTVVIALWQDEFSYEGKKLSYTTPAVTEHWIKRPGNRERLENLKWAKHHCDGLFRVVIAIAEDTAANPRAIKECFPHPKLVMRIVDLNEATGEFHAVSVDEAK